MTQDWSQEQILEELTRRAEELWGPDRAAALSASLLDAAHQLWEIRHEPPDSDVEPGFYQ